MQYAPYGGGTVNYEPNTLGGGEPKEAENIPAGKYHFEGDAVRQKIILTNDFEQAGERYRLISNIDRDHLVDNIIDDLGKTKKEIQKRMVVNLTKADSKFGIRVSKGLKL
jgi:catalase